MSVETFQVCIWAQRPLAASMGHNLITFVLDRLWLLRIRHQITTHQWLNRSVIFFQKHSILWCMLDAKWAGTSSNFCSSFWSSVSPLHLPICIPLSWFYMYLYKIKVLNNLFNIFLKNLYKVCIPTVNVK